MKLIADVFPKLRTPKHMVRAMPEETHFRGSVQEQHGKCRQTMFKLEGQFLRHIYWSLGRQLSYKKSVLQIWKISRLFRNTLSADDKYSLLDRDNITQRIQMLLSLKQKNFCGFFSSFLKSSLNSKRLQRKDDPHSWCISEITDSKTHG